MRRPAVGAVSNAQIQSILARCLMEPDFLDRVTADPASVLDGYGLEESARAAFIEFDFSRIRNFAGFIAKVQHNYLWESFPGTLNLLKLTGLQIPIFSSYNRIHQRLRTESSAGKEEKIRRFLEYLDGELEHHREPGVAVLRDVMAHEAIMWRLAAHLKGMITTAGEAAGHNGNESTALRADQWDAMVPSIRGVLVLREFEFDPVTTLSELERGNLDPARVGPSPQNIGYWGDSATKKVRVLALGRETAVLLSEVDGRRTVRAIIERTIAALGDGIEPDDFCSFFENAFREGLLQNVPGQDSNEDG